MDHSCFLAISEPSAQFLIYFFFDSITVSSSFAGPIDPYGIGLPKDAEGAVEFVDEFLAAIEKDGLWEKLWQIAIGDRIGATAAPDAPAIGVFE